ncbi:neuronal acetylcholine receptor subunit alpha-7 isoform X1 [Aplysia californica]|uniref:Neuronal acetylcholine receptor subunit alpha-7 isoform X1 n=1 Tax=Aplysia californica TaxID=6500 RepID=A0ABM1A0V9_APLCA|nr:neuronal acetylcholine receptor subunit alpha-7 isoform X1 [Aplysia californica]XP_035825920.1 neuronal acetylcholine receptor subunit alpha-7 isoform X1 [Aplysia californica]
MEARLYFLSLLTFLLSLAKESQQGQHERRLLKHLFQDSGYNKYERPAEDESNPVDVKFGIILQQIIDVDEKNQIIHTNIWLQMTWHAYNLKWNAEDFGNVSTLIVPRSLVWVPDILMYNSASEDFDETYPTNVVLSSDGSNLWVPPGMFKSTCAIDITWFPFDDQLCDLKFGSWTYVGGLLNLTEDSSEGGDLSSFIRNGEWMLIGLPVERHVLQYDCCPEVYIDLTYTIHIRRRTLYYGFNIIIPCVLISSLTLLLFILPPDAGEKISLGVTILLSLMVFLLLVAETMPPTSDAVPLIGIYFACIMMMCSLSIVFTVVVLNFHYRSPDTHTMPRWVKRVLCGWLAWLLRMERPGGSTTRRSLTQRAQVKDYKLGPLEEKSRSLMANVLDMDDDPRMANGSTTGFLMKMEESMGMNSSSVRHDITSILRELKKITSRYRKEDEESDVKNDWKFAAMVMDRLCLVVCCVFTLGSTVAILASAPHLLA